MIETEDTYYLLPRPWHEKYLPQLESTLAALPEPGHLFALKEYANEDQLLLYKMLARFMPFTYTEYQALIAHVIRDESDGTEITEAGKENVERVTIVLVQRARAYLQTGEFVRAMELAFAVLSTIEPERSKLTDDDMVYLTIEEDAGDFITELLAELQDSELAQQLYENLLYYTSSWKPQCAFFKQDCRDWKRTLRKRIEPHSFSLAGWGAEMLRK